LRQRADKWQRAAGWFLLISYVIGSPAFAILEAQTGTISERFGYSAAFLYSVGAAQFVCAAMLFVRAVAPWSCLVLSVLSIGAIVSHFRIGSPATALPAVVVTLLQIWYGIRIYRKDRNRRV
jgi:hypothetical protein